MGHPRFSLLETTFFLRCSAYFLLTVNMRCNVISMVDTKYPVLSPYPTIHFGLLPTRSGSTLTTVYNNEMSSLPKPTIVQPSWYPYSRTGIPRGWWWCWSHWHLTLFGVIQLPARPRSEYRCGSGEGGYRLVRRWVGKDRREEGM